MNRHTVGRQYAQKPKEAVRFHGFFLFPASPFPLHARIRKKEMFNNMKLAEALQERSDLNTRIAQLRTRISNNALVQEGEQTAEDPAELIRQLNACVKELEELIGKINLTNSTTKVEKKTLTEWLASRDALTLKLSIYRDLVNEASTSAYRARGTEIRIKPAVNVASLQKEVDQMSRNLRLIDNTIQAANWSTELK